MKVRAHAAPFGTDGEMTPTHTSPDLQQAQKFESSSDPQVETANSGSSLYRPTRYRSQRSAK